MLKNDECPSLDSDFLSVLRAGDEAAFATLVQREGGRMRAVARRLLGCEHDAEDTVQDALLLAYRAIARFHGECRLSTWLHRIVVNAALMKMRSRRRKPEAPIDELSIELDSPATEEVFASAQSSAVVRTAIDRLPESYRRVVMVRDIEGFDTEEAAAMLDTTPSAIKVRLHRARRALRLTLDGAFGPVSPESCTREAA